MANELSNLQALTYLNMSKGSLKGRTNITCICPYIAVVCSSLYKLLQNMEYSIIRELESPSVLLRILTGFLKIILATNLLCDQYVNYL